MSSSTMQAAAMAHVAHDLAVIDLVAHLYTGSFTDRRELAKIWDKYTAESEAERKQPGFELVREKHRALSRAFEDDPDGSVGLDLDDLRILWEEFVDALRDATIKVAGGVDLTGVDPNSYEALETPVIKKNKSFANLVDNLSNHVSSSPETSNKGGARRDAAALKHDTQRRRRSSGVARPILCIPLPSHPTPGLSPSTPSHAPHRTARAGGSTRGHQEGEFQGCHLRGGCEQQGCEHPQRGTLRQAVQLSRGVRRGGRRALQAREGGVRGARIRLILLVLYCAPSRRRRDWDSTRAAVEGFDVRSRAASLRRRRVAMLGSATTPSVVCHRSSVGHQITTPPQTICSARRTTRLVDIVRGRRPRGRREARRSTRRT